METGKDEVYWFTATHKCLILKEGMWKGSLREAQQKAEEFYGDVNNIDIHISRKIEGQENAWEPVAVLAKGKGCLCSGWSGQGWRVVK